MRDRVQGFYETIGCRQRRNRASQLKGLVFVGVFCALIVSAGSGVTMASPDGETGPYPGKKPVKGIRIDHVDRDASERVAWIRVRVLSDTPLPETWSVLENVEQWSEFMDLYSKVERIPMDGPLDRYAFFVSPPWPIPKAQTIVRILKNPQDNVLDYWIEQGFMAGTYGTVAVGPNNGGSRLLFENLGPPDQRFPDWMVKMGVYLVLPSVLKEIRDRVLEIQEEAKKHPGPDSKNPVGKPGTPPGS